jgi:ribonuclease HI
MDLWRRILDAAKPHEVEWVWVRGHSGDVMNERADVLATEARIKIERCPLNQNASRLKP